MQADKVSQARLTFGVMEQYGCRQDVVALNCLLSALCRYNQANAVLEFFVAIKQRIAPDADTYALIPTRLVWDRAFGLESVISVFGKGFCYL